MRWREVRDVVGRGVEWSGGEVSRKGNGMEWKGEGKNEEG